MTIHKMPKASILVGVLMLGGCVQTKPSIQIYCPSVKTYSPADQTALAAEVQVYGDKTPHMVSQLIDWDRMQQQLNRCNGVVPNAPAPSKKGWF